MASQTSVDYKYVAHHDVCKPYLNCQLEGFAELVAFFVAAAEPLCTMPRTQKNPFLSRKQQKKQGNRASLMNLSCALI